MKKSEPLSIILILNNRNKRFLGLVQDFSKSLNPFSVSGLTRYMEKIISIDLKTLKILKLTHIWIFSQCKLSMFLHFSNIFSSRILSFEILKFILKKEFFGKKNFRDEAYKNTFLFLNNISEKSNLGMFLNKQLRRVLPLEKKKEIILENFSKIILFDFDNDLNIMEYRCYIIGNNSLLLPRKVRKLKKLKKNLMEKNLMDETYFDKLTNFQKYCKNNIKNIVRIIEIGPRITAKILKKF
jgi:hypothetical protein